MRIMRLATLTLLSILLSCTISTDKQTNTKDDIKSADIIENKTIVSKDNQGPIVDDVLPQQSPPPVNGRAKDSAEHLLIGSGGGGHATKRGQKIDMNWIIHWNHIANDTSGIDHTPESLITKLGFGQNYHKKSGPSGESNSIQSGTFGAQLGPLRSSRAMAIVHIALFEAANAIIGGYQSYTGFAPFVGDASIQAALGQAAHDTLVALFPGQSARLDQVLADDLAQVPNGPLKNNGIIVGQGAAQSILAMRSNDGSNHAEPVVGVDFNPSNDPGKWRKDPISNISVALGARWTNVTPFVMTSPSQFRAPIPPALTSPEYALAFNEVKRLGGDGLSTTTERNSDQTDIGIYWAYDGTPSLCAPPRLYNQIAMTIAENMGTGFLETLRLLALINTSMADAGSAVWDSKYFYQYWRPVTGIREADADQGPSGLGDANAETTGDPNFSPLGAPASNLNGPNFTPPFPAYPSGHAGFGGALFQTLRRFYGKDDIAFTFVSDELNGQTKDNQGNPRPLKPRSFTSLSQAEDENGQSRIYLGIHWVFDKTEGIAQGNKVANYVFDHAFLPKN
jgi:hypothetical protein